MNGVSPNRLASAPMIEATERFPCPARFEPALIVQWHRVLFLHFEVEPAIVQAHLPMPFELALYNHRAIVSLVALTKRRFRPVASAPWWARLLPLIPEQRLFNVRTYVLHRGEPGAFFFWGWLSRPWGLPLPDRALGLTCAFARLRYEHQHESGELRGVVGKGTDGQRFAYEARMERPVAFAPCPAGSLAEFALERCTAYFWHRGMGRVFRAWHPPWLQATVQVRITDNSLVTAAFPWLRDACFVEANYTTGFAEVRIGRPLPVDNPVRGRRIRHHGASAFFELP